MPQLDKVTFLSQFFWLSFFYLGFYFFILKFFLPRMSRILKLRKKKMAGSQEGVSFLTLETENVRKNFNQIITKTLNTSKEIYTETYKPTLCWVENWVNKGLASLHPLKDLGILSEIRSEKDMGLHSFRVLSFLFFSTKNKGSNNTYVQSVGDTSLSDNSAIAEALLSDLQANLFTQLVLENVKQGS